MNLSDYRCKYCCILSLNLFVLQANVLIQNVKITLNKENPDSKALLTKTNGPGIGLLARPVSHAGQRSALGDIRNKVSAITIDPGKKQAAIKKEIVELPNKLPSQQSLVLNKAKATSSLKSLVDVKTTEYGPHVHLVSMLTKVCHVCLYNL